MNFVYFKIEKEETIDDFLRSYFVSKKTIYKQELFNLLRVDGEVKKLNYMLKKGDVLEIKLAPFDGVITPHKGKIDILYEDDDIVIVNKPAKILIHEDGNTTNTLTNIVNFHYQTKGYDYPVLATHRLDYETTGIVLFAKHFLALSFLSRQFEEKKVSKKYFALCEGYIEPHYRILDYPIMKDRHSNKYIVNEKGKQARTEYQVVDQFDNKTKCEVYLNDGGRTHQIRVHLSYLGHPVVGDKLYGIEGDKFYLHFHEIEFIHPRTQKKMKFKIDPPF